jgi:hypothetical protein
MLKDPRAERSIARFHREWLKLDRALDDKSDKDAPAFAPLRASLPRAAAAFVRRFVWERDADLPELLTTPEVMGDRAMAAFYGLPVPTGEGFEPLRASGDQRRFGLLTLPVSLAALAHGPDSAPVLRGKYVAEQLRCTELPSPPPTVPSPPPTGATTTRERFAQHVQDPSCSVCHTLFDPLGFGLENYDGFGRWRVTDNGAPIVAKGYVASGPAFDGPAELAELLATGEERGVVESCVVKQWFRYAFGRGDLISDGCAVKRLVEAYVRNGRRTKPLLVEIATSEAFLTRGGAR